MLVVERNALVSFIFAALDIEKSDFTQFAYFATRHKY